MPDPNANEETFDLPTAGTIGRGKGVTLQETALAWSGANGPWRRAFDEIITIELEAEPDVDEPYARCVINFANGQRLRVEIAYDAAHAREVETFRAFVFRFFTVLGPARRSKIVFREGVGPIKRVTALVFSGGGCLAFIGIIIWLAVSGEYQQDYQFLLFPLAFLFVVMMGGMFVISLKIRLKPFDPMEIPPHALPTVARKSRSGA